MRKKQCWYLILFLIIIAICISIGVVIYHYEHTFMWFNNGLPTPEEVATWDEHKLRNTLFRLSRWESFINGAQFNKLVNRQIRPLAKKTSDKFHFLEVGMGVGAFSREILRMFPHSTGVGIDIAPATIEIAKVVLPSDRMTVMVGDMQHIASRGSEFHVIFVPGALCLLLSMDHVHSAVAEFHRLLKPGGGICISLIPSEISNTGACNTRIPKKFWSEDIVYKYGFIVLALEEMDDWHLPHSNGRYSVCLQKPAS